MTDIWIPDDTPDRVCFDHLDSATGRLHFVNGTDASDGVWVSFRDLWSVVDDLDSLPDRPAWVSSLVSDWRYVNAHNRPDSRYHGVWMPHDRVAVVASPYVMTLADRVYELHASDYRFSDRHACGWVVSPLCADDIDAFASIVSDYELDVSPRFQSWLERRGDWQTKLSEAVETSQGQGFAVPELPHSERSFTPWQATATMALQQRPLLTDQVGLGKGGSFIGGLLARSHAAHKDSRLDPWPCVLTTTSTLKNEIAAEIGRWDDTLNVEILSGTTRGVLNPKADIYVLNHDILHARCKDLVAVHPRSLIADEAHAFKTPTAKRSRAMRTLAEAVQDNTRDLPEGASPYIVMATGTPFDNAPVEVWNLLSILGVEQRFGDYAMQRCGDERKVDWYYNRSRREYVRKTSAMTPFRAFELYFCDGFWYGDRNNGQTRSRSKRVWSNRGAAHIAEFNALLNTVMVRRRKADVMTPLPPIHEHVVTQRLTGEGLEEYRRVEHEFEAWCRAQVDHVMETEGVSRMAALRIIARRLASNKDIMQMTALRATLSHAKVQPTVDWITRFMEGDPEAMGVDPRDPESVASVADRRKLIVFVHHRQTREALLHHPDIQKYGVVTILPTNEQTGEQVQQAKEAFQSTDADSPRIIICTMAAREGHTLTAARDVFILEPPFVASWVTQMVGRCWARLPDVHEAHVHMAIVPHSDDIRSLHRIRRKAVTFKAVVDNEAREADVDAVSAETEQDVDDLVESMSFMARSLGIVG